MKKQLLAPLLLLLLAACSGSAESPVIEITGFFIEGDTKDYSEDMASIPSLKVGIKDFDLPNGVSSEKNFTRPEEGIIKFEDGVRNTVLKVKMRVQTVADADAILSFYLSSKAECESAQEKIELKTEDKE